MHEHHRKPLEAGHVVGGYDIVRVIGQGGFGIVYEGLNPTTRERVAIKQFYPNALASWRHGTFVVNREDDKEFIAKILERFQEEARLQFTFDHPNILKVKNFVSADNTGYMITEYIDGNTVPEFLKPYGSTFPDEAMFRSVMNPILDAVNYVHERGTLHRDISPDNIMVDKFGKPVLVDFGAAKLDLRRAPSASSIVAYRPEYAPVEQREPASERPEGYYTDIFALAGTMYRLLSGNPPVGSVARSLASKDPYILIAEVSRVKCSDAVFKAIDRGLVLPPKNRPATIEEFAELLGWRGAAPPLPEPPPPPRPPPPPARWPRYLSVIFPVAAVIGALVYVSRPDEFPNPAPSASPTSTAIVTPRPVITPTATPSAAGAATSAAPDPRPATPAPDPRIAREKSLYESALKCIQGSTSCDTDACLTPYRSGIGYADRYPSLREEYEKVKRNPRCAPPPVASPSSSPAPDPRIAQEQRLYEAALKCIRDATSCDTDACLTPYRGGIGYADRYPSLREEYEKVKQSSRCAPPPTPRVTYRIFENRDIEGGDINQPLIQNVDEQACSSTCDNTKDCIGYAYGKWDRACYLKQSLPNLRQDPNSTAAIRSDQKTPPDFPGGKTIEETRRTFAGNRYSTLPASSRGACSKLCASENACLGYQFVAGSCWRYDRIDFATKDPTAQAGVKRQPAPSH